MSKSEGQIVKIKAKQVIFMEGDPADALYIIREGRIRTVKESENRLIPLGLLQAMDFLGDIGIFDGKGLRETTAITLQDSVLVKISSQDIQFQLRKSPPWIGNIMLTLSDRLKAVGEIIKDHKIMDENLGEGNFLTNAEEVQLKEIIKIHRKKKEKEKS